LLRRLLCDRLLLVFAFSCLSLSRSLMTDRTRFTTLLPFTTLFRSVRPQPALPLLGARRRRSDLGISRRRGDRTAHLVDAKCRDQDRKSTRLNSSHRTISYAVFCLKKKTLYAITQAIVAYSLRMALM